MTSLIKKCLGISKSGTYSNGLHFISNESMVPSLELEDSKDAVSEFNKGYVNEDMYSGSTTSHSGLLRDYPGLYRSGFDVTNNRSMIGSLDVAINTNRFDIFHFQILVQFFSCTVGQWNHFTAYGVLLHKLALIANTILKK